LRRAYVALALASCRTNKTGAAKRGIRWRHGGMGGLAAWDLACVAAARETRTIFRRSRLVLAGDVAAAAAQTA